MTLFSILNMGPNAAFAILCILGEILHKNVQGGQCVNPLKNLHQNETLDIQKLLEILKVPHWTYFEANNTQRGRDQASPRKKTLELCFRTMCFDVDCSCNFPKADECTSTKTTTVNNTPLGIGDSCLNCMVLNTRMNGTKNELEKLRDYRFQPLLLAVAFILGAVFGCLINIFKILFCRNRQSKQQVDSLEDIQFYSKFVGDTSAYSEIALSNQHGQELANAGANTGEYLEPISKKTILQKASKLLEDQDENCESNAYFTLTLDRRHADGDGYHHLKPNSGRISTSPIYKDNDSLYHTMASAESDIIIAQVDNEHAENSVILEKHPMDGCCIQSSDVESKGVQGEGFQGERLYSMCIHARDITGNDDTDNEIQERNEITKTENAYFLLEKQIV